MAKPTLVANRERPLQSGPHVKFLDRSAIHESYGPMVSQMITRTARRLRGD